MRVMVMQPDNSTKSDSLDYYDNSDGDNDDDDVICLTLIMNFYAKSNSGTKAKEDLAAATHAVQELMRKIHEIKTKAEQSRTMVQEICHDIKKLDSAKKHITTTITALHHLTMFVILRLDRVLAESFELDNFSEVMASNFVDLQFEKPKKWVAPYPKYEYGWWEAFLPKDTSKAEA